MELERSQKQESANSFILIALRVVVTGAALWAFFHGEWEAFFISLLTLGLSFIPELLRATYKIRLPIEFEIVTVLFITASIFMGEFINAYERFWWWDAVLHVASGIVLGFAGFLILYILFERKKVQGSPFIVAFFSFSFAVALGVLWEIFEYAMDQNFGTNMQKSGLQDTMWDLIVDAAGAIFVAALGYRVLAGKHKGMFNHFVERFMKANPQVGRGSRKSV